MDRTAKCIFRAWLIWVIAACFYSYEFFIRVSPTVMVPELIKSFAVDAATLGNLSAFYYYAYASMQIPVGVLLDRFGIRRLLTFAAGTVSFGSFLFASTHHLYIAEFGRVLMGVGSAFSFVGCLKLATNWFPTKRISFLIGLTNTLGVIGAINAEAPLSLIVQNSGWRTTMLMVGIAGAALALLIRFIIRDDPETMGCQSVRKLSTPPENTLLSGLWHLVRSRQTWLTAIYAGLMVAPIAAFTELWSVPYLVSVHHLANTEAAGISSVVFIGIAIGGPSNGWFAGFIGKRRPVMAFGSIAAFACLVMALYVHNLDLTMLTILLFMFGFFTSSMLLAFAINIENNPSWATGTAVGFTNMIVMLGGTVFQPLIGVLLDYFEPTHHDKLVTQFDPSAYQHALILLPICQLVAFVLVFFLRKSHTKLN